MSPTIEPGEGYVVLPASVAGGVSEGDIVLYEAREFDGGGLTTHRVVDTTEEGYITKGDNNPFTDRDGGEPPVQKGQVVGVALQVGGGPVTVPWIGALVTTVRGVVVAVVGTLLGIVGLDAAGGGAIGIVAVVVGLLMLLASVLLGGQRPSRSYSRRRGSFVLQGEVLTACSCSRYSSPPTPRWSCPAGRRSTPSSAPRVPQRGRTPSSRVVSSSCSTRSRTAGWHRCTRLSSPQATA